MRMAVQDRRAQLVDAALAVATADGVAATTVRRVAEQAGVALGVVHYAFTDKDELLAELAARVVERLAEASEAGLRFDAADAGRPDLAETLAAAVAALWDLVEASAGEQLLTYEITTYALRNPELRGVARQQYDVSQAAVERMLRLAADAASARWTRPLGELAGEVLAYVDGVALRWLVDRDGAAARARMASYARYLTTHSRQVR